VQALTGLRLATRGRPASPPLMDSDLSKATVQFSIGSGYLTVCQRAPAGDPSSRLPIATPINVWVNSEM
jgi:hypothetical protein